MHVTLRDIAGVCQLDASTVSRALRHDQRINAETAEKVRQVAARLGYRPNLAARLLVRGTSHIFWFVVPSLGARVDWTTAEEASVHAARKGYDTRQCGLAAAVGAENRSTCALGDLPMDILKNPTIAPLKADIGETGGRVILGHDLRPEYSRLRGRDSVTLRRKVANLGGEIKKNPRSKLRGRFVYEI